MAQLREMRRGGREKVKEDLIFDNVLFAQIYVQRWHLPHSFYLLIYLFLFYFYGFFLALSAKAPPALPD